jgi:L-rhamnose isomerase/sugar isomerase
MATDFEILSNQLAGRGVDVRGVVEKLKQQRIETPSWGYGNAGTRFKVFPEPGAARTIWEKLADAAVVHRMTAVSPSVAIHIPWDKVDDYRALRDYAADLGIKIGAVNPNLFQELDYRLGSITHPDAAVRRQAIDHMLECIDIAKELGSNLLSLWFADGTNYPGQDSISERKHRMEESLAEVYRAMPPGMRMLVEYKFFEPAFYHTDLADWGMSYNTCLKLGPQAQTLVDTGHHAQGTNIEHIVAFLLDELRLGGFHFNDRKYADDDLMVGSINPYQLFLIYHELVQAERNPRTAEHARAVAYMIDQSPNLEPKIEGMIQSVTNIQSAYARALLVNYDALLEAQRSGNVLAANRELMRAFDTDVRPLLARAREELDAPPDPIRAYRESGYLRQVAAERGVAVAGAGYSGA